MTMFSSNLSLFLLFSCILTYLSWDIVSSQASNDADTRDDCLLSSLAETSKFHSLYESIIKSKSENNSKSSHQSRQPQNIHKSQFPMGAVVSLYADMNRTHAIDRWNCQLRNHGRYCEKHGYRCYFVTDNDFARQERENSVAANHRDYWFKLQVLRKVLKLHPWVLYLDTDTVFEEPERLPSIEALFNLSHTGKPLSKHSDGFSVYVPGDKGWSTDTMFFRNTIYSHVFLEHVWGLRFTCPHCNGEQCAFIVALLDAIAGYEYHNRIHEQKSHPLEWSDKVPVAKHKSESCCIPRKFCEYPSASLYENIRSNDFQQKINSLHSKSVLDCVWNWQSSLGYNPEENMPVRSDHPHITWAHNLRHPMGLNLSHPVKNLDCSNDSDLDINGGLNAVTFSLEWNNPN